MDNDVTAKKNSAGKLKASIINNNRMNTVDLFTDHIDSGRHFHIVSERINSLSDILVFLSSPPPCPSCNQPKLKLNEQWNLKEWFLKFFGRRVFHCNNCGWKHTVKLHQWERETIITALAVALILIIYSIQWVMTGK
ncbi:MAG: hypothetical protein NTX36_15565 [Proteobacteria bacterium]|nr:hypothetical protein [Pseudomonadota bacterium]